MRYIKYHILGLLSLSGFAFSSRLYRDDLIETVEGFYDESSTIYQNLNEPNARENDVSAKMKLQVQRIMNKDCQFEKAFYSPELRHEFLEILCQGLAKVPRSNIPHLTVGIIISDFDISQCSRFSFVLECLLDYVDRQPVRIFPELSDRMDACKALALKVVRHGSCNFIFWRKFAQIIRKSDFSVSNFVKNQADLDEDDVQIFFHTASICNSLDLFFCLAFSFLPCRTIANEFFNWFMPDDSITPNLIFLATFGSFIYQIKRLSFKYFIIDRTIASFLNFFRSFFVKYGKGAANSNDLLAYEIKTFNANIGTCETDIASFLCTDIQFQKAFYTINLRQEFISNVAQNLRKSAKSTSIVLNKAELIKNFDLKKYRDEPEILICVLEYIDRIPKFEFETSNDQADPLEAFAISFLLTKTESTAFWEKFCQLKKISRHELLFLQIHYVTNSDNLLVKSFSTLFGWPFFYNLGFGLLPGSFIYILLNFFLSETARNDPLTNFVLYSLVIIATGLASYDTFLYENFKRFRDSLQI